MSRSKGARAWLKSVLPQGAVRWLRRSRRPRRLASADPVNSNFGLGRGAPIDRYYIEGFLAAHESDVHDRVMEFGDRSYTTRFGGERVIQSDVLHAQAGNPIATIIGDLATGEGIPHNAFDCIICTQTLMFIYDVHGAVRHLHDALRPGGVALVTVAGISQIARYDMDHWGDFWRFTSLACRRLFSDVFGEHGVEIEPFGNVLAAKAMLHGLVQDEMTHAELDRRHRDYELIIGVRAKKAAP